MLCKVTCICKFTYYIKPRIRSKDKSVFNDCTHNYEPIFITTVIIALWSTTVYDDFILAHDSFFSNTLVI